MFMPILTHFNYSLQIILTHEHADAILGLDDVRIVQSFSPTNDIEPTPIYLSQFAMDR
jgi:ribonuclease BN (tRNA processing enzyme)